MASYIFVWVASVTLPSGRWYPDWVLISVMHAWATPFMFFNKLQMRSSKLSKQLQAFRVASIHLYGRVFKCSLKFRQHLKWEGTLKLGIAELEMGQGREH